MFDDRFGAGDDEDDEDEESRRVQEIADQLRAGRQHLILTVKALVLERYTPDQCQAIIDRSARLVRRSELLMYRIKAGLTVH